MGFKGYLMAYAAQRDLINHIEGFRVEHPKLVLCPTGHQ
jgi:hypothetical protein